MTSSRDEISSTEKLLHLIRSEQGQEEHVVDETVSSVPPATDKPSFLSKFSRRDKKISVGVDIGYNSFRMVKLRLEGGSHWRLVAQNSVSFDPSVDLAGRDFTRLFRKSVFDFCGSTSDVNIWCNISSSHVDVRYLQIPKVSAKHLEKTVYWAFRNEITFDEQEMVLDYELREEFVDKGVKKIGVLAYTAPHSEIQARQDLFQRCRLSLAGVTLLPFAMQNFFRSGVVSGGDEVVCNLYVGRKWSRIDIFFKGTLVLVRGIKTGVESMEEALVEALPQERISLQKSNQADSSSSVSFAGGKDEELVLGLETAQEVEQEFYLKLTQEEAAAVLSSFSANGEPLAEDEPGAQLGRKEVFSMILPAVDRLVRQIERTFDHYTSLFYDEPVSRIYVSGRIQTYKYLTKYISEQLGVLVSTLDPFDTLDGSEAAELSASITDRSLLVPACGLALSSNNHTPNTLHTYGDRAIAEKAKKATRIAIAGFFLATCICVGVFFVQSWKLQNLEAKLAAVQMQLATFKPRVNKDIITIQVEDIQLQQKKIRDYSTRYMPLAAFAELSERSTDAVRLLAMKAYFGNQGVKEKSNLIKLDGVVSGEREELVSFLGEYLALLASSRVLGEVERDGGKTNILDEKEVFRFYAKCRVE